MAFPKWMRVVYGRQIGWRCEECGRQFKDGWLIEFHHILPTSAGGPDTFENMQALCVEHHYYAHLDLRSQGIDHPSSASTVYARWQQTGGRTRKWRREN